MRMQANRGRTLEHAIILTNEAYRRAGTAVVEKIPTEWIPIRDGKRIVTAKVEHKAVVDFIGRYGARAVAFDAKQTEEPRIGFKRVEPHQAAFLDTWTAGGQGIGFILVGYGMTWYVIPWEVWRAGLDGKVTEVRHGKDVTTASLNLSDLPYYRVARGRVGMDYLLTVDILWGAHG